MSKLYAVWSCLGLGVCDRVNAPGKLRAERLHGLPSTYLTAGEADTGRHLLWLQVPLQPIMI
jgi:hypothetical protein